MFDIEKWRKEKGTGENLKDKLNDEGYVPLSSMETKSKKDLKKELPDDYMIVDWDVKTNPIYAQAMYSEEDEKIFFLNSSGSYIGEAEKDQ